LSIKIQIKKIIGRLLLNLHVLYEISPFNISVHVTKRFPHMQFNHNSVYKCCSVPFDDLFKQG